MEPQVYRTFQHFIDMLKVPVRKDIILRTFESQEKSDFLSVISKTFKDFSIEHLVVDLPNDELQKIPLPAIAEFGGKKKKSYVILSDINKDKVSFWNSKGIAKTVSISHFLKKWSGVALLVDEDVKYDQFKMISTQPTKTLNLDILVGIFVVLGLGLISSFANLESIPLLLLQFSGMLISTLLLFKHKGMSDIFKKVCEQGDKFSCDKVIGNTLEKGIFRTISIPAFAFIYFSLGFLLLAFFELSNILPVLFGMSIIGILAAIVSIFVQWRILQSWCALCLSVSAIILIEFSLMLNYGIDLDVLQLDLRNLALIGVIVIMLVYILNTSIERLLLQANPGDPHRLINYKKIMDVILETSEVISFPTEIKPIVLNKIEADNTITIITSPGCPICVKSHPKFEQLVSSFSDKVKFQMIIVNSPNDSKVKEMISKLIFREALLNKDVAKEINAIYSGISYGSWSREFDEPYPSDEVGYSMACDLFDINLGFQEKNKLSTPSIIMNNKLLPEVISLEDLKEYLLQL